MCDRSIQQWGTKYANNRDDFGRKLVGNNNRLEDNVWNLTVWEFTTQYENIIRKQTIYSSRNTS